MRPGLTGLVEVSGRSYLSWEERFELDNEYIRNCGFILDCKIIWKTVLQFPSVNVADIERIRQTKCYVHEGRVFRRLDVEK